MQRLAEWTAPMDAHDDEPLTQVMTPPAPAPAGAGPLGAPHLAFGTDAAAQLRWAQKMETLGRLTARVVHEVNNQVTLMLGRTTLVLQRTEREGASRAEVEELHRAAEQVARLMRRWQMMGAGAGGAAPARSERAGRGNRDRVRRRPRRGHRADDRTPGGTRPGCGPTGGSWNTSC